MSAFFEGWRRVLRAPAVTSGLLVATIFLALFAPSVDVTRPTEALRVGPLSWIGWMFSHEVLGFGGVLTRPRIGWLRLESFWSAGVVFFMFVSGGVLDRLARNKPTRTAAFFAACGVHFFRFLRLGALLAVPFALLVRLLIFAMSLPSIVPQILVFVAIGVWSAIGDYAKVRIVVEDRHSALGALIGSVRFMARHPLQTVLIYLLNVIVMMGVFALGRAGGSFSWFVFLILLLLFLLTRLSFMASSIALFQSKLAHAGYVAAPLPMWPDSPSAEALQNLVNRKNS
jgi:hypothetical protein